MILEKQIFDAKFVMSKDELPYIEVLEDFDNTEFIYVLTYNISQRQHELVDELNLFEEIKCAFYTYSGHSTSRDVQYYRGNNEEFSTEDIGRIERYLERYRDLLEQANRLFSIQIFRERYISNLDTVIDRVEEISEMIKGLCESSLTELASFSEEEIENQYLNDNYAEAYDENLDRFAQEAVNLAGAEHETLAEECKEDVDSLLELLDEMAGITENVLRRFNGLPLNLVRIDNTGI